MGQQRRSKGRKGEPGATPFTRLRNGLQGLADKRQAARARWAKDRQELAERLGVAPELLDAVVWCLAILALGLLFLLAGG